MNLNLPLLRNFMAKAPKLNDETGYKIVFVNFKNPHCG
jgi:hypothetical protein